MDGWIDRDAHSYYSSQRNSDVKRKIIQSEFTEFVRRWSYSELVACSAIFPLVVFLLTPRWEEGVRPLSRRARHMFLISAVPASPFPRNRFPSAQILAWRPQTLRETDCQRGSSHRNRTVLIWTTLRVSDSITTKSHRDPPLQSWYEVETMAVHVLDDSGTRLTVIERLRLN